MVVALTLSATGPNLGTTFAVVTRLGKRDQIGRDSLHLVPSTPAEQPASELLTFLFADVRSYTRFTAERGDEVAARLAGNFASVTRAEVGSRGGEVIELRGDEA